MPGAVRRFDARRARRAPRRLRRGGRPGAARQRPGARVPDAADGDRSLRPLAGGEFLLSREPRPRPLAQRSRHLDAAARSRRPLPLLAPRSSGSTTSVCSRRSAGSTRRRTRPTPISRDSSPWCRLDCRRRCRPIGRCYRGARRASGGCCSAASTTGTTRGRCSRPSSGCRQVPWTLTLIRNPNQAGDAAGAPAAHGRGALPRARLVAERVRLLDWVPAERRYDLLRDVDVLAAPHQPSLETRLSLRTRFLDAFAAGCPVVVTAGGAVAHLSARHGAGWVVRRGTHEALAAALREASAMRGGGDAPPGGRRAFSPPSPGTARWRRSSPSAASRGATPSKERFAFRPADPLRRPTGSVFRVAAAGGCRRAAGEPPGVVSVAISELERAASTWRSALPPWPSSATPGCRGRWSSSTTARATAPREWLGREHPRVRLLREPGEPRLRGGGEPSGRGDRGRRRGAAQQRHAPAAGLAGGAGRRPGARRPPDVAAISGRNVDWQGERHDFAPRRDDLRRPRLPARLSAGRSRPRGCPRAGDELLFACGGNMLVRSRGLSRARRPRRRTTSPTTRTSTSAGGCGRPAIG